MRAQPGRRVAKQSPVRITGQQAPTLAVPDGTWLRFEEALCQDWTLLGRRVGMWEATASQFVACSLERSAVLGGRLSYGPPTTYVRCKFLSSDLRHVLPGNARFEECTFTDADLRGWVCRSASFVRCRFKGRLEKVVFYGSDEAKRGRPRRRIPNDFAGNDFTEAELLDVGFRKGVNLRSQKFGADETLVLIDGFLAGVDSALAELSTLVTDNRQELKQTLLLLRGLYDQDQVLLEKVSVGPSADPLGRAWQLILPHVIQSPLGSR